MRTLLASQQISVHLASSILGSPIEGCKKKVYGLLIKVPLKYLTAETSLISYCAKPNRIILLCGKTLNIVNTLHSRTVGSQVFGFPKIQINHVFLT